MLTALRVAGLTVLTQERDHDEPPSAGIGDCYAVRGTRKEVNVGPADCAADNATYRTAVVTGSPQWSLDPGACPDGAYRAVREGTGDTQCLMFHVRVGDCLNRVSNQIGTRHDLGKGRCGPESESKVRSITTGPRETCGPAETTTFYSEPATTICLGKP
ncbi:hypothetical protein [Lentzea sp. NPDC059081]|uniref:LppU/SCO3897 family protein n=1 Tax=Lentzea sp. NPDC059081 TaxID=3346719 RepID=UPI0036CAFA24